MIDAVAFNRLKRRVSEVRTARDQAQGRLNAIMQRLDTEFGCKTIIQAERKAAKLAQEAQVAEAAFTTAMESFNAAYGEHLG